jgi:hypothetical protein
MTPHLLAPPPHQRSSRTHRLKRFSTIADPELGWSSFYLGLRKIGIPQSDASPRDSAAAPFPTQSNSPLCSACGTSTFCPPSNVPWPPARKSLRSQFFYLSMRCNIRWPIFQRKTARGGQAEVARWRHIPWRFQERLKGWDRRVHTGRWIGVQWPLQQRRARRRRRDDVRLNLRSLHVLDALCRYAVDGSTLNYTYSAGDTYSGGWKDDKRHGSCTYKFFDGETVKFTWLDDVCPEFNARQSAILARRNNCTLVGATQVCCCTACHNHISTNLNASASLFNLLLIAHHTSHVWPSSATRQWQHTRCRRQQ